MKLSSILMSLILMTFAASTAAAPAQGGGNQGAGNRPQSQPKPQERVEKQTRENRDEARGKTTRVEEQVRERDPERKDASGGQSQEMQARSAERQEIQEAYRAEGEKVKGKKPWWKFWGSDDPSADPSGKGGE